MWNYVYTDELYHAGIKGMKWGQRRYQNADGTLTPAGKQRYRKEEAKKQYKDAKKEFNETSREARRTGFGIKGIQKQKAAAEHLEAARLKTVEAKAKYNAAKAKNAEKAAKAEMKTYVKEMSKTGLRDSYADAKSGGKTTSLYNSIQAKKGKAYADKVEKRVEKQLVTNFATSVAVLAGAAVVSAVLEARY